MFIVETWIRARRLGSASRLAAAVETWRFPAIDVLFADAILAGELRDTVLVPQGCQDKRKLLCDRPHLALFAHNPSTSMFLLFQSDVEEISRALPRDGSSYIIVTEIPETEKVISGMMPALSQSPRWKPFR
jgi:hypothetical protein